MVYCSWEAEKPARATRAKAKVERMLSVGCRVDERGQSWSEVVSMQSIYVYAGGVLSGESWNALTVNRIGRVKAKVKCEECVHSTARSKSDWTRLDSGVCATKRRTEDVREKKRASGGRGN